MAGRITQVDHKLELCIYLPGCTIISAEVSSIFVVLLMGRNRSYEK